MSEAKVKMSTITTKALKPDSYAVMENGVEIGRLQRVRAGRRLRDNIWTPNAALAGVILDRTERENRRYGWSSPSEAAKHLRSTLQQP